MVSLTQHAVCRMSQRGVRDEGIVAVLRYGRETFRPGGAVAYTVGKREVLLWRSRGVDLSPYGNLHVICGEDGVVLTTYRNRNFRHLRRR